MTAPASLALLLAGHAAAALALAGLRAPVAGTCGGLVCAPVATRAPESTSGP